MPSYIISTLQLIVMAAALSACGSVHVVVGEDADSEIEAGPDGDSDGDRDPEPPCEVSLECDHDADADIEWDPDDGLLVVFPLALYDDEEVSAVLGRGPDAQVQRLDMNGRTVFEDPGAGPYTVTLALGDLFALDREIEDLWTWEGAPGPVVLFQFEPWRFDRVDFEVETLFDGVVRGATPGREVSVQLLLDGVAIVEDQQVADEDGSFSFSMTLHTSRDPPVSARIVATEWDDQSPVALGTLLVADRLVEGDDVTGLEVSLDQRFDRDLEVIVDGYDPASQPLHAVWNPVFDGHVLTPWRGRTTRATGEPFRWTVPAYTGSLACDRARIDINAGSDDLVLYERRGQMASLEWCSDVSSPVMISLMPLPVFITEVGARSTPVRYRREELVIEASWPEGSRRELLLHGDPPCDYFYGYNWGGGEPLFRWRIILGEGVDAFEPFSLPEEIWGLTELPDGPMSITLFAQAQEGDLRTFSTDHGFVVLEGPGCPFDPPAWLVGDYTSGGGELGVTLTVDGCGRFSYSEDGMDYLWITCGHAEAAAEEDSVLLVADEPGYGPFWPEPEIIAVRSRDPDGVFLGADARWPIRRAPSRHPTTIPNELVGYFSLGIEERYFGEYEGVAIIEFDGSYHEEWSPVDFDDWHYPHEHGQIIDWNGVSGLLEHAIPNSDPQEIRLNPARTGIEF